MEDASAQKRKLHHLVPAWVSDGSVFHIRIRCNHPWAAQSSLIEPKLAKALLDSACFYHTKGRWYCPLFLLMPDHIHALLAFPPGKAMSRVIGDWKRFQTARTSIAWQDGFFDHRIRNAHELELKAHYIRQNPIVKSLCTRPEDWPWLCEPAHED